MNYALVTDFVTQDWFARLYAALLLALPFVAPFARSAPAADAPPITVTILGDSLTAGYGVDKAQAYPSLLQDHFADAVPPVTIVNAGVSGNTTAGGLRRLAWIMRSKPDVLVIALGGNDGLRGIDPKASAANLAAIIERARKQAPAVKILLAGMQSPPNMGKDYTSEFEAVFTRVAKEKEVALVPFLLEGVAGHARFNLPDGIHPNPQGHQKIRDLLLPHLSKLLNRGSQE